MSTAGPNSPEASGLAEAAKAGVAALILAAGASSRMGAPKPLLPIGEETFLDRLIRLFAAHCSPVIVVLGHRAETIRAGLRRGGQATIVVNAGHAQGQLSSLQCGLRAVPPDTAGVLFTPVDYPGVRPETVAALAAALIGRPRPLLVIPRHEGRRGHPVGCARELFPEFLALPPGAQARDVVRAHALATCYIDVNDPAILEDIDDPAAYGRLLRAASPR